MEDVRHHKNGFSDYSPEVATNFIDLNTKTLNGQFRRNVEEKIEQLLKRLDENKKEWINRSDSSIYTGNSGIAYLFYFYGKRTDDLSYLNRAIELIERSGSRKIDKKSITFLTGEAGRLALGAVVNHSLKNEEKSREMISRLKSLYDFSAAADYDELLYGRAGYFFSLLFVNKHISEEIIDEELIKRIIKRILMSGKNYSSSNGLKTPLMYSWHEKEYLGGAHGLAGILYMLLQARKYLSESQLTEEIKPAIDYLATLRFSSKNFPSSVGNKSDRLVHWCHGAPSMTMLFTLAFKVFNEEKYLKIAKDCGDVVWERGLLKKGCGICHGTSGNAYSFLNLYQETQDLKYLYRSTKFAEWCFDYLNHQNRIPDRPFSLFEGLAGIIYFFVDFLRPNDAKFPGYTL